MSTKETRVPGGMRHSQALDTVWLTALRDYLQATVHWREYRIKINLIE